ncbi:GAF domain-containing protein [Bradyrhizobium sp. 62]|uniref:GAF domain-containing protein n=1 Tax=Bradyrhizobium sp. 62 TaxID=1043588 RepID=UPI001FF8E347|nr:GAF domain-containing protein [Bradyrhizobium sp. 62]MCK1368465.1 GAF domain-containing protein [Bradyrhizobium sp. 62]
MRGRDAKSDTKQTNAAENEKKTGKRHTTVGPDGMRVRKSGVSKSHKPSLRKPTSTKTDPRKQKPSLQSQTARLKRQLKTARMQQEASAEIMRAVANASGDAAGPVFDTILESCQRLFDPYDAAVYLVEGDRVRGVARRGPGVGDWGADTMPLEGSSTGAAIAQLRPVHFPDLAEKADLPEDKRAVVKEAGGMTVLYAPIISESRGVGSLVVTRRPKKPFTETEIAFIQSFADQAAIAIENARLFNEVEARTRDLGEALEQQTATADVLRVISRSAFDLDAVMHTLARSAAELCAAGLCGLYIREGDFLVCRGYTAIGKEQEEFVRQARIPADDPNFATTRVLSSGEIANIGDFENDRSVATQAFREKLGFKSLLLVPLMREGQGIGLFILGRDRIGQFSPRHVELVQTFADQAVIAIENARLFDEVQAKTRDLGEALEQQTATSEVLAVISRSPSDLNPVLEAISDTAARLCGSEQTMFFRYDGSVFRILASWNFPPEVHEMLERRPLMPGHPSAIGRAGASLKPVCIPDVLADPAYGLTGEQSRARYRATLAVPLLREGRLVGALSLNRSEPGAFTEKQIELVTTFADQAVIAIENTRLFNETKQALERESSSAEILQVISSSPTDVQPVFDAIVASLLRLFGTQFAAVQLLRNGSVTMPAVGGKAGFEQLAKRFPRPLDDTTIGGLVMLCKQTRQFVARDDLSTPEGTRRFAHDFGFNSVMFTPMIHEDEVIGSIGTAHPDAKAFDPHQISLIETFARQAVLAIHNLRLFNETKQTLAYQTGSSNVLRVIASSPTDVGPVLKEIVESARELCEANDAVVLLKDAEHLRFSAHSGPIPVTLDRWPISRNWTAGRAFVDQNPVHVHDMLSAEGAQFPDARAMGQSTGATIHTVLSVPLLRGEESIGAILLRRTEVRPFNDKQINLLSTFADQAVIAIQNARQFNETREALERQTATADILKVIASSPDDVQPVFQAIAERSNHLVGGFATTVVSIIDDVVHLSAFTPTTPAADAALRAFYPRPLSGFTYSDAVRRGEIHRIVDTEVELAGESDQLTMVRQRGWRSALWVPLLLEGEAIGVIGVTRVEPGAFADHHVDMLKTFADQAVIAISNVNLFRQVQERTRELSGSLDDLRAAQDRLVQTEKLASLGQLTAGIAHEIKNPLNFVNNFSTLSVELIDEMSEIFENPALDEAGRRKELDEIREVLKSNLEKVVQHGKRADSIVKNMLLHSREGSGDQRAVDINALLDESLNLAYHGARAEKPDFNITLQRDLDPDAGVIELFPQEITRAFLNLISNGFYAASKRRADNGDTNFEPVLSAVTRNLGNHIEIRIRDNGTGIPPEVKEKMFNPFFTTKPAGEGTGLGLSMSHDIIVKQHGGRLDVNTQPGQYTEFTIVLPRVVKLASAGKN